MKAIILVAGYATRLYPLTKDQPKALLLINKRPIIDYLVDEINTIEAVDEIYVVSNSKFYEHFVAWGKDVVSAIPIKVLDDGTLNDESKRGAIGDIVFAIEKEKIDDEIMVCCGDNFFTFKLEDYYRFYKEKNRDCVIVKEIDDIDVIKQFAVAVLDENGCVKDLVEKPQKPKSNIAVFATYFYAKETIPLFAKCLQEGVSPDAPGSFVEWLYKQKEVYAYTMNGECYDIGTHKAYEEVNALFS